MPAVAVVTDSTASLTAAELAEHQVVGGLRVVPLDVVIDDQAQSEEQVSPTQVAAALRRGSRVSTSRPNPAAFAAVYDELAQAGATAIVAVLLSGEVSGTCDSARLAVGEAKVPVTVVDSRQIGVGVGFATLAAARAAARGVPHSQVAAAARSVAERTEALLYVDTLEYLKRGGRVTAGQAWVGNALAVKPLLQLRDGRVEPLERVRTASRALGRLVEVARERAHGQPRDVGVLHLDAPDRAAEVLERVSAGLPEGGRRVVREVGGVLGAHVGPGMVGVALSPLPD
jgi:DegV family protein with EDD domain